MKVLRKVFLGVFSTAFAMPGACNADVLYDSTSLG